ncbi:MAG: histidine kinase dimerization/phospho-acceptor domain-containing protein, partial [Deltaproteobacteria bacterium]|nr:histidine kinase dimerization/phospho-acceptor domain-containing protein [Deltaproteobacteria bacterium]
MSGRGGFIKRLNSTACSFRGYCSILGLKIALPIGFFLFLPTIVYLFLHEYRNEGFEEVYEIGTSPFLWAGMLASFAAIMVILSKLVILPLKRFELHIGELEKGNDAGPFKLERNDEIGFLVERFNSLHKIVTGEIGSRDEQLSVLYRFTNATSGVFDIPALMESLFTCLKTAVSFDIGAYALNYQNYADGRIYSASGALAGDEAEEITQKVLARASICCRDFPKDKIGGRLDVSVIGPASPASERRVTEGRFIELPLICYGEAVGVVLISIAGPDCPLPGWRVFEAMVKQASMVVERLLAHISDEQRQLSDILSSMSEGVYLIDKEGRAASINKKGMELADSYCRYNFECSRTGFDGIAGNCPVNAGEPCDFSAFINKVRKFGPEFDGKTCTEELKNGDGMVLQVSVSGLRTGGSRKEGFVVTAKDITEDRLIQKRVMLSSKLAALGEMAAGIAHEVNNPLQVMLANIELLDGNIQEKGKNRLIHLKDGVFRIKSIVKDLLIFAREQTTEVEDIDVNRVVEKVVDMLGHQLQLANINIDLDLDRRPLAVKCNRNLFQQVIINLLHNAKDAIEEAGKGTHVRIRTVLLPGGIVVVEVSDDGPGI